jgi:hypothetical protein
VLTHPVIPELADWTESTVSDLDMPERWLPIPGLEGRYEVSDLGRVRSLDQHFSSQAGNSFVRRGRVLKANPAGNTGYLGVSLPEPAARSGWRLRSVHSLVALAFLGPRPEGKEVRHLDGVKTNCALSNLAYGTGIDNEADKRRYGTVHEKSQRTVCPLDHRLESPNLVLGALKRGHRNCMACARGRSNVSHAAKRGVALDLKAEADRHYRSIMEL